MNCSRLSVNHCGVVAGFNSVILHLGNFQYINIKQQLGEGGGYSEGDNNIQYKVRLKSASMTKKEEESNAFF